jgi:Fic-DOC domain mobile mystery protein B
LRKFLQYPDGATKLDPNEIDGLIPKHISTQDELNELELANIQQGLSWLDKRRNPEVLSLSFVCLLHKKLFGEVWQWAGSYRKTGKNIGIDPKDIETQLAQLLSNAEYWRKHNSYMPTESALRFHHQLTFIHAFPNGNGRHARIMADAFLEKIYRVKRINWSAGETLGNNSVRRSNYIAALQSADSGDMDPLIQFTNTGC